MDAMWPLSVLKRDHVREQLAFSLLMTAKWCANNILKNERRKDSEVVEQIAPLYQFDRRYLLSSARRSHYVRKKNASYFLQ